MSYMNESAWPGPDAAGNEAEDSGVIQATPENEAADTSGVQGTSEELRPAEESGSVAGQEQTAAVEPEADTTEPSGTKPARKRGGKKKGGAKVYIYLQTGHRKNTDIFFHMSGA